MNRTPVGGLPLRHATAWSHATRHPFLEAVRDGPLTESAFEAWLAQDYRFVSDLLAFQGRLLARAPRRTPAYRVSVPHRMTPQFATYVGDPEQAAAAVATRAAEPDAEAASVAVLGAESRFWTMALQDEA